MIHADDAALVADLERRPGGRVVHHEVKEVDYVRDTTVVDVRYRVGPRKYAIAALHPEVPPNPWHQTLRRYFTPLRVAVRAGRRDAEDRPGAARPSGPAVTRWGREDPASPVVPVVGHPQGRGAAPNALERER